MPTGVLDIEQSINTQACLAFELAGGITHNFYAEGLWQLTLFYF
jgi:hypothetical protein